MISDQYIHPVFGTPCSRQRRHQVLNMLAGKCAIHKDRDSIDQSGYCQECAVKARGINPRKKRWESVDWNKGDSDIAAELGVSYAAVRYQRRNQAGLIPKLIRTPKCPLSWQGSNSRNGTIQPGLTPEIREKARSKFRAAVARGKIEKKPCAVCGEEKVEGHHFDYTKPLEVIWLCKVHHGAIHGAANPKKKGAAK
jgi:hypothetical protein